MANIRGVPSARRIDDRNSVQFARHRRLKAARCSTILLTPCRPLTRYRVRGDIEPSRASSRTRAWLMLQQKRQYETPLLVIAHPLLAVITEDQKSMRS